MATRGGSAAKWLVGAMVLAVREGLCLAGVKKREERELAKNWLSTGLSSHPFLGTKTANMKHGVK